MQRPDRQRQGDTMMKHPDIYKGTTLGELYRLVTETVEQCPSLTDRAERAALILLIGKVVPLGDDFYSVTNSEGDGTYLVDQSAEKCACLDWTHRAPAFNGSRLCKHRLACLFLVKLGRRRSSGRAARLSAFRRPARRLTRKAA